MAAVRTNYFHRGTKGLPYISIDENDKIQNAIKEVSKRNSSIMRDFNNGYYIQSIGSENQKFINLVQDSFLSRHVLEPTKGENELDLALS